jgi:hypothetical protein
MQLQYEAVILPSAVRRCRELEREAVLAAVIDRSRERARRGVAA